MKNKIFAFHEIETEILLRMHKNAMSGEQQCLMRARHAMDIKFGIKCLS